MVGIGEHINRNGQHTDFVLRPKFRTLWSNEEEKMTIKILFVLHGGERARLLYIYFFEVVIGPLTTLHLFFQGRNYLGIRRR
jgi:hypothetical protein